MGLRIRTNVASLTAQRQMANTSKALNDSMDKLSSGYRINKASDDAAGLAISEQIKANLGSLGQAKRNASDGISMIQIAEGGMNEVSNILVRLRELSTQAASDTVGAKEREFSNREYTQLVDEVDRLSNTVEFNGIKLLKGAEAGIDTASIHVGSGNGSVENSDTILLDVKNLEVSSAKLELGKGDEITTREGASERLATIDNALSTVSSLRATMGAKQSRLNSTINNLSISIENQSATNSRIKDVDFAAEVAVSSQNRILAQSGISVLSQANSIPEMAVSLIRG
ncbi:MAG: flagellin [Pseudomonadota bacterium]